MQKKGICSFIGISAFLLASCGEENPAVFPMNSTASEMTSSSIQNAENSSSSLATSTLSSSEQTESSSQIILSSSLTVEQSSSSVDAISSNSNLSSSGIGPVSFGEMTDERDGHIYKTVKIGEQIWMAENLNYAYPKQDSSSDSVSWCYNNEPDSCAKYGRLYLWSAAMDSATYFKEKIEICLMSCSQNCDMCGFGNNWQHGLKIEDYYDFHLPGVCPPKWHIPSVEEWDALFNYANKLSSNLKSTNGWLDDGNGSDVFGFKVLPAGQLYNHNEWYNVGKEACFWTPIQVTKILDDIAPISDYEDALAFCFSSQERSILEKSMEKIRRAVSVRCVKDAEASE